VPFPGRTLGEVIEFLQDKAKDIFPEGYTYDFNGDAGIVESYISYLRRKLDQFTPEPVIQTKRGFGYMLKASKA
jgi:DNA-binding response OmpR family regulator